MVWTPRTTVAAVIERDGRFLLVEEETSDGVVFNQPAGHLDEGESLTAAVVRETLEETAHPFEPEGLVGIYRWQIPPAGLTYVRFTFHGRCGEPIPGMKLDTGIRRALWLSYDELIAAPERLRSPLVLRCIDDYRAGRRYPLDLLIDLP